MDPGNLLHGGPNVFSVPIEYNWNNSDLFHHSHYGWLFYLSLLLLPVSGTPGDRQTCFIACRIVSGFGSQYLGI